MIGHNLLNHSRVVTAYYQVNIINNGLIISTYYSYVYG
jgi:hypothetical protein